jgi:hypothetical protein
MTATLKDSLYYLDPESGVTPDRATGVLIGAVGVLMAQDMGFQDALTTLKPLLPTHYDPNRFPPSWHETLHAPRHTWATAAFSYHTTLTNTLFALSPERDVTAECATGILIGCVALLMAQGQEFSAALKTLKPYLPKGYDRKLFPPTWHNAL